MSGAGSFLVPAEAYDRWMGRYSTRLASALIEFAGVSPGMRALDVGCGPGALTEALASVLGPGSVAAAEPSGPFVEACRVRLPGVEIAAASAEALPFADEAFDAALSQLVVNFMHDPRAGVSEMRRVTRPGGVVAACVWDYAGEMTLLSTFWQAARELEPEQAAAVDETKVMRWCDEGQLEALWRGAGLCGVRVGPLVVSANYTDFEDLWSPLPAGVGPAGSFVKSLDEQRRALLHEAFRRLLEVPDGPFQLTARAWAVVGTVDERRASAVP
jgi:SAM-dependent methyltransferase